jgi:Sec-independent protein secretion pathway component TatC
MLEELKPHIAELRTRLIRSIVALIVVFFICFTFWEPILGWVIIPLKNALSSNSQVIAYKMGEQFFVAVIISFFAAFFVTLPYILNLTNYGFFKASKDPYFAQGINTYSGKITHEAVADSLQLKDYYQPYQ